MLVKKSYIYREVLEGFCRIKVLKVLQTTPNCLGNIGIKSIKKQASTLYIFADGVLSILQLPILKNLSKVIKIYKTSYNTKAV